MPIEFVSGDRFGAQALAHGCICQGSMGAGVATGFREPYPELFTEYRRRCKAKPREFNLGDAWLWKDDEKPWPFNLGTQEGVWRGRLVRPRPAGFWTHPGPAAGTVQEDRPALPRKE